MDGASAEVKTGDPTAELGFNPDTAWNVDGIAWYEKSDEELNAMLADVPEQYRMNVRGKLAAIAGQVRSHIQAVKFPDVGKAYFDAAGQEIQVNAIDLFDPRNPSSFRPMAEDEIFVAALLEKQLGAKMVSQDPISGARQFSTASPGINMITFQNDGQGKIIDRLTGVRMLLTDPKEVAKPIFQPVEKPTRVLEYSRPTLTRAA